MREDDWRARSLREGGSCGDGLKLDELEEELLELDEEGLMEEPLELDEDELDELREELEGETNQK
jgi:hypothetical protein